MASFLAFKTIKSDFDVGSTLGAVQDVKQPLFAEERGANSASSTNCNSA
jgi:hypothetical protein